MSAEVALVTTYGNLFHKTGLPRMTDLSPNKAGALDWIYAIAANVSRLQFHESVTFVITVQISHQMNELQTIQSRLLLMHSPWQPGILHSAELEIPPHIHLLRFWNSLSTAWQKIKQKRNQLNIQRKTQRVCIWSQRQIQPTHHQMDSANSQHINIECGNATVERGSHNRNKTITSFNLIQIIIQQTIDNGYISLM